MTDDPLGLRPALTDVIDRQQTVLKQLRQGFQSEDDVASWKSLVVQGAVGRVSPGLRALLADQDLAVLVAPYYLSPDAAGVEFRALIHDALSVEFAQSLREMSGLAHEEVRRSGIGSAGIPAPSKPTTYR